jgi:hypothetical protein
LVSNAGVSFAERDEKITGDQAALAKLKHERTHMAKHVQPFMDLSEGIASCGQQSMSSMADMSVIPAMSLMSMDFADAPTTPPAGSMATDRAIRRARTVRPICMAREDTKRAPASVK